MLFGNKNRKNAFLDFYHQWKSGSNIQLQSYGKCVQILHYPHLSNHERTGRIVVTTVSRSEGQAMMYPYMTLSDQTEITYSEMKPGGCVKVYIETPDAEDGFHHAICWLPRYEWQEISGYSEEEMDFFRTFVQNNTDLFIKLSQHEGILNYSDC